ncbi:MFS transporter [Phenylobacterium terrae]|uniref:MFS transporter n=1 Tax=Phenylobacterium terrae TaxID=2665495 RepID=A0ABW4N648_9CAUL
MAKDPRRELSLPRKAGFAMGDYACNLYWQSLSLFVMFYYTDVVGLSGATAGLIYMVASIFDGATDPIMGALADRTRTRFGRFRPYLLAAGVPLAFAFVFMFWKPALDGAGLIAVVLAAHLLFRLAYTAVSVPYSSLTARMTRSSDERSTLAGFRMVFAALAGLTVSYNTQPLVAALGGGDEARGFFYAACVFALLATGIFPLVFLATREPPEPAVPERRLRVGEYWLAIRNNRAFWVLMAAITVGAVASSTLGKAVIYYFKYIVGDADAARYALSFKAISALAIIPAWVFVSRRIGKQAAWITASIWGVAGSALLMVTDATTAVVATAFFILMHVASLGKSMTVWSMMPDTVEYGEWKSGVRAESFIFGLGMFFQKAALGIAAGLFGWALDLVGYRANVAQTPETLFGMKMIVVLLPAISFGLSALIMLAYPLKRGRHEAIVDEIAARRAAADPTGEPA